jgi:hypothetical protein
MKNMKIFCLTSVGSMEKGEQIQGLGLGLSKPVKIQDLDPVLLTTVNTNTGVRGRNGGGAGFLFTE